MTRARPSRALRARIGLGVTVLSLAGPAVRPAAAEDGAPPPAALDLAGAAVDAALETVSALSSADAVPPASTDAPPSAPITEDPAASVISPPGATTATEPLPPAPTAPSEAPTEPEAAAMPISASEPVAPEPAPEPAPAAAATQVQPLNLNVAVRVDSPGDNGAVEQVNAAIVAVVGTPPVASTEQYQPAAPQYQPPQPPAAPPATAPASPAPAPAEPGWTWTWMCGGSATDVLGAGGGAALLPANWRWNWNWNCGEEQTASGNNNTEIGEQYHSEVMQYQPVNLNVSIRIGSPGNDGPVTQTNVAVVVVTPPLVVIVPVSPTVPLPSPDGAAPPGASAPAAPPAEQLELVFELLPVEIAVSTEAIEATDWIFRSPSSPFGVDSASAGRAADSGAARSPLEPLGRSAAWRPVPTLSHSDSALAVRAVAVVHAQASVRPDRPAQARTPRKPSRRPLPPMRAPVLASGFAGATPGGADGGGWPLLALLLVPFSLALVDSSRRMGRDAALPTAAEFFTRRERPG